jgi:hypothetical protein
VCLACHANSAPEPIDLGLPGASAEREYERGRRNRERRTREEHPQIGGWLFAVRRSPQHEEAWRRGADGERKVAESLARRTARSGTVILQDRRGPGGRANIDHIAVAPSGVYVVDAKDIVGRVKVARPLLGEPMLIIGGRNRTHLIDGLEHQIAAVRSALDGFAEVPVQGVLCFTRADLPRLGTTNIGSHLLVYRKRLAKLLNANGALAADDIERVARALAVAFPAAA